ncbi:rRNA maturation RNase YbeY [Phycobacter azelaicus]|jgi:probable rRNA maturation factor|uniref:rRNA maturation RNase YbeY n=1 Tax=Phycobacter azelaicus TaxID=2668075 RepID=UPI001866DC72|nr:rRNA maturation RNase YbeY [Phycobacter azelaicus]MBE1295827.1 rRNA maturation RNase YbeY [Paracoccaceae bacterium]
MTLEISLEDDRWNAVAFEALAERSISTALDHFGLDPEECEISLLACDDARIADLNAEFRDKPTPTNVLSWPADDLAAEEPGGTPLPPEADFTGEISLGDVAIAYETCAREADEAGKPLADHLSHLLVHGVLHLLGYDHIRDPDATVMEALEVEILGKLGIDDPYTESGSL